MKDLLKTPKEEEENEFGECVMSGTNCVRGDMPNCVRGDMPNCVRGDMPNCVRGDMPNCVRRGLLGIHGQERRVMERAHELVLPSCM
jgi:hypothetical protein